MTFYQFVSAAASNPISHGFDQISEAYPHGVLFEAARKRRGKITIRINGSVVPFEAAHFIWATLLQGEAIVSEAYAMDDEMLKLKARKL